MKKKQLAGGFLAIGILAVACGSDGGSSPAAAGAGGKGATTLETLGGGGADTDAPPTMNGGATPRGEGGSPAAEAGGAGSGGAPSAIGAGGFEEVHGDPPIDPKCGDYSEHKDKSNGYSFVAEETALDVDATAITICGRIDAYHFEAGPDATTPGTVDADAFRFNFLTPGSYLVSLELLDDALPDSVTLDVLPQFGLGVSALASGKRAGAWLQLTTATTASVLVTGLNAQPLAHSVSYKVHVRRDDTATKCTTVAPASAAQKYAEAHDGAGNQGNDVVHYQYSAPVQTPTAVATDAPEPSGIVLNVGNHSLIQGNAALVDYGDDYDDTDMYAFKSGTSSVLTLRLDWAGTKADLDIMLFNENGYVSLGAANSLAFGGPEVLTLPVVPQTNYWLYVASGSNSKAGGLPAAYGVTLCGDEFKF